MLVHAGRCEWRNEFEVDHLMDYRGNLCAREYLVRWKDYSPEWDLWVPRGNIHHETIKEFELVNGIYDQDWPHRCDICDLPCKSQTGVKIHRSKAHKTQRVQNFNGTAAAKAAEFKKLANKQASKGKLTLQGVTLENVTLFKYLGSLFAANGLQQKDLDARIAMAMERCGQLGHLFDDPNLGPRLKIRLYKVAVCSLLTYGCESWCLNNSVLRQINGANSSMLARFTGQTRRQEARRATTSFDLVRHIRVMRLKWLGFILCQVDTRLIKQAIAIQSDMNQQGNILMDAPNHTDLEQLVMMAKDKAFWSSHTNII